MSIAEDRLRHAEWAKSMAAQYRSDARATVNKNQRDRWLKDAERMDDEATWAEKSAEYMQ